MNGLNYDGSELKYGVTLLNKNFIMKLPKKDWNNVYCEYIASNVIKILGGCVPNVYLGKFEEGEQHSRQALREEPTFQVSYANIAVSLLMQGKTAEAEQLYRQYKNDYRKVFMEHITELEQLGTIPEERKNDVERIKAMLKEEK